MAMSFTFNIHPFGYNAAPLELAHMRVHSAGNVHEYTITYKTKDGPKAIRGSISKVMMDGSRRSGHRNLFHVLRDILDDVDLAKVGKDYIHVLKEIREQLGYEAKAADYPGE